MSSKPSLEAMRHSMAHILASAVVKMFPEAKLGVGPAIENGFYYDFDLPRTLIPEDLEIIKRHMQEEIEANNAFVRTQKPIDEAISWLEKAGQHYDVEMAEDLKKEGVETISFYQNGSFINMCRGPHLESTGQAGAFELTSISGAYWKGDETRPMLQRIYGVAFLDKKDLKKHLMQLEEAKKRDHRKLGVELDLFTFSELVGSGLPLFTPKGTKIINAIKDFLKELQEPMGYEAVDIPHITKADLYKTSGHWEKFKDDLFHVHGKSETTFALKPMNCPHHTQIYASKLRSYRDLPLRYSEVTKVYRDESSGELQGLSRVRSITQDDGHVFCRPDQVTQEGKRMQEIVFSFYKALGMEPDCVRLSVRDPQSPEKYLGTDEEWEKAESQLIGILDDTGMEYFRGEGEAAFYGPKIDYMYRDSLGRQWQLSTIQYDYFMPQRFGLKYVSQEGQAETPVMIHRAICGSLERFLSVVIEHFAGAFPLWMSPLQVQIIPIADRHLSYCQDLQLQLRKNGLSVDIDSRSQRMNQKIREAQLQKVPYMVIVGDQEQDDKTLSIRTRDQKSYNDLQVEDFIRITQSLIDERSLSLWEN